MAITYQIENDLPAEEFTAVLRASTLGLRRPVDDPERMAAMVRHANLIVTARLEGKLIGVSRSVTDFVFCTYLSDLAVEEAFQRQGIGRELIRQTKLATPQAKLILLSAPAAVDYYPRIGMTRHEAAFFLDDAEDLRG
ncbi:MAG TPA: GNAT family N-acetyltransferase [Flavilitoribacter sp.]|nr:GNAT family N-acetyltransferase [Flavilitoribacter sp.]HMQ88834.1 GNAT family N-acetyltransferase [Flavilitoribacter sp.]